MGNYNNNSLDRSIFWYEEFTPRKKEWAIPWENNNPKEYCIRTGAPCVWCTYADCENRTSERPTSFKKLNN